MNNAKEKRLLEEYRANVELWKHDDMLRQKRNANFLTVNTILLVAFGTFISINFSLVSIAIITIIFSIFGIAVCLVWTSILNRNAEYVRFRRFQLRSIEARLPGISTFTNTYEAFYKHKRILFTNINDKFTISSSARARSTITEGNLPIIIGGFWVIAFIGGTIALIVSILGSV